MESLTSHVITLTPILAKILTSDPYNCWPLLLRKSVNQSHVSMHIKAAIDSFLFLPEKLKAVGLEKLD